MLNEPLQRHVNIHLVLGGDAVAADFPALDALQIPATHMQPTGGDWDGRHTPGYRGNSLHCPTLPKTQTWHELDKFLQQ